MRSLKITLILAVFCLALTGVTLSTQSNTAEVEDVNSFDLESNQFKIADEHKKAKKPPQA